MTPLRWAALAVVVLAAVFALQGGEYSTADWIQLRRDAREEQADFHADEIIEIADTEPDPNKARVRIDARKWKAAKMQPKKYGDKIDLNHSGAVEMLTDEQLNGKLALLLGKAGIGVAAGGDGEAEGEA